MSEIELTLRNHAQTYSGAHTGSYKNSTGQFYLGDKTAETFIHTVSRTSVRGAIDLLPHHDSSYSLSQASVPYSKMVTMCTTCFNVQSL